MASTGAAAEQVSIQDMKNVTSCLKLTSADQNDVVDDTDTAKSKVRALLQDNQQLKTENKQLKADKEEALQRFGDVMDDLSAMERKVTGLKQQLNVEREKVQRLQQEKTALQLQLLQQQNSASKQATHKTSPALTKANTNKTQQQQSPAKVPPKVVQKSQQVKPTPAAAAARQPLKTKQQYTFDLDLDDVTMESLLGPPSPMRSQVVTSVTQVEPQLSKQPSLQSVWSSSDGGDGGGSSNAGGPGSACSSSSSSSPGVSPEASRRVSSVGSCDSHTPDADETDVNKGCDTNATITNNISKSVKHDMTMGGKLPSAPKTVTNTTTTTTTTTSSSSSSSGIINTKAPVTISTATKASAASATTAKPTSAVKGARVMTATTTAAARTPAASTNVRCGRVGPIAAATAAATKPTTKASGIKSAAAVRRSKKYISTEDRPGWR